MGAADRFAPSAMRLRRPYTGRIVPELLRHWPAFGLYAVLSLALSWPTALHFTDRITGVGEDPLHNLWIYWHTLQALLLRQPLFAAPLLYYPRGASLLTHGLGPVTGLFALPFWPFGLEAAHNGALLVSLWLTGLCMYASARGFDLPRDVSLFAGVMLMASPMCMAGLFGTVTKVFLGLLPLSLLATHYALSPNRGRLWTIAPALALLLTFLHSGYQFVFAGLGVALFMVAVLLRSAPDDRRSILIRALFTGLAGALICGPLLLATLIVARDPALAIDASQQSSIIDLALFGLPSYFSLLLGSIGTAGFTSAGDPLEIERAVSLAYSGIALTLIGLFAQRPAARRWTIFTLVFVLISLGPVLKLIGQLRFTVFDLPVALPYAWLISLPGLSFIRASGRFMMIGYVGFALAASSGLAWLVERWPRRRRLIVGAAIVLILAESWPQPFPQRQLPPVPDFYKQIAADNAVYGVFDLPIRPDPYPHSYAVASAPYQVLQITHHKGIVGGYLSRTYAQHPWFSDLVQLRLPSDQALLFVNGRPVSAADRVRATLAAAGYRYVVWHKTVYFRGNQAAEEFVSRVFAGETPVADDELAQVYAVATPTPITASFGANWWPAEATVRWARSPAQLELVADQPRQVALRIVPAAIHDPSGADGLGPAGELIIRAGDVEQTVSFIVNQPVEVMLDIPAGRSAITLELKAGNFSPRNYGAADERELSFAVYRVELDNR